MEQAYEAIKSELGGSELTVDPAVRAGLCGLTVGTNPSPAHSVPDPGVARGATAYFSQP